MRPASDAFLRAVRSSHTMAVRARVCSTFQTGTDPDGTLLDVLAGDVQMDATADVRSTLDITVSGVGAWPINASMALGPYGNEIYVERGIKYGNGRTEYVGLGYFRIQQIDQDAPPDGPIAISARDRMAGIVEAQMIFPIQFDPIVTYGDAVASLVEQVYPGVTIEWDDDTDADELGRSVLVDQDRYAALKDLVTSRGKIFYWDYRGVLVIKDIPAPDVPVFDVTSGRGGVLVTMKRTLTRDGIYNAVVASGDGVDGDIPPAHAVAVDGNTMSPTYFYGPFGQVPRYYSSPLLLDDDAAGRAAETILAKAVGLPYTVDFSIVCNPALEPYDVLRVRYSNRYGDEIHVAETLTVPLLATDPMTGTTRQQGLDES